MKLLVIIVVLALIGLSEQSGCPNGDKIKPCTCRKDWGKWGEVYLECTAVNSLQEYLPAINKFFNNTAYILRIINPKFNVVPHGLTTGLSAYKVVFKNSTINKVSDGAFSGSEMTLKQIEFDGSMLTKIPSKSVANLKNLYRFQVSNTKTLETISNEDVAQLPKSIVQLLLYSNSIKEIDGNFTAFPRLVWVDFYKNKLTHLPMKVFPPNIRRLNLARNLFNKVPIDALMNLRNDHDHCSVEFEFNNITTVPASLIPLMNNNNLSFYLKYNPLICGCDMMWIGERGDEFENSKLYGTCRGHNDRKGADLGYLTDYDFIECYQKVY